MMVFKDLKQNVENTKGKFQQKKQALTFDGTPLDDNKCIAHYQI